MIAAQRKRIELVGDSPRVAAQRAHLHTTFGSAAQLRADQPNRTGLPTQLKAGIEQLSGMAMDDVRVHFNSAKPAELGALAYAQGNAIHVAPGQEQHLPHEAWHVVQQKQGRVRATMQTKGIPVNDDSGLEREADLMGARAFAGALHGGQTLDHASPPSPTVYQRVVTAADKKKIAGLSRAEVIERMKKPPKKEKPEEIARVYLASTGDRRVTPRALAALMREAGLEEREEEESSDDEREEDSSSDENDDPSSNDESSAVPPTVRTPAAAHSSTGGREPVESKEEASSPSLTELAKRQLAAAAEAHRKNGNKGTLQAPTMGVGRYRSTDSQQRVRVALKTSNQRNLPGTDAQARLDRLEVLPSVGSSYPNMHAEMVGVRHSIEQSLHGTHTHLEEMGASQEICFLCELVMTMLGVTYDKTHISKAIYSKWDDPTGKFTGKTGEFITLAEVLKTLGVSPKDARRRLIERLSSEMTAKEASAFADRLLAGELQGGAERQKLLKDLKNVPSLAAANQRKKGKGHKRKASASTKQGRRIKRELAKARKAQKEAAAKEASRPTKRAKAIETATTTTTSGSTRDRTALSDADERESSEEEVEDREKRADDDEDDREIEAEEEVDEGVDTEEDEHDRRVIRVSTWQDAEQMSFRAGQRITLTGYPAVYGRIYEFQTDWHPEFGRSIDSKIVRWINR